MNKSFVLYDEKCKFLVCRVVYQEHYKGFENENYQTNMSYVNETGQAGEINNFVNRNGICYAFYQANNNTVNINRIGKTLHNDYIDDVLVIFIATPRNKKTRIVGIFEHARVYRHIQHKTFSTTNQDYLIEAKYDDYISVTENERNLSISIFPKGKKNKPGRAGSWFADNHNCIENKMLLLAFVNDIILDRNKENDSDINRDHVIRTKLSPTSRMFITYYSSFTQSDKDEAKRRAYNRCEYDSSHQSFTSKSDGVMYLEVHHLIPRSKSLLYPEANLNSLSNAVVLCPNCHRLIHHAIFTEKEDMIKKLYSDRIVDLTNDNIVIDYDLLESYYK